ncbi:MAG: hypothetical protein C0439_14260 [Pseudomonas sp.]|nr:hypothetical protein [Pseudomonas sp.]
MNRCEIEGGPVLAHIGQLFMKDCYWPILLKKSAMVATAEEYAPEIEIFTLGRGFQAQISRSSV